MDARTDDAALDDTAGAAERLRGSARAALGVTGRGDVASLRQTLATSGVGIYPALALGLLVAVDQMQTVALTILAPEITGAMGVSRPSYALVLLLKTLVVTLAALPFAAYVQRRPRRAAVSIATAFAWAVLTAMTAYVISIWGLLALALAAGVATASVRSVHQPLLVDSYPPEVRVRVMSFYQGFDNVGNVVNALVLGACTAWFALTWRGVFLVLGAAALLAAVISSRLRDPGFGVHDTERVRQLVRADAGTSGLSDTDVSLGFFEIARRLMLIPTVRRSLVAYAVLGMLLAPLLTYMAFFLQERWGMGPGARAVFSGVMPLFGIAALRLFSDRGERLFAKDPASLLHLAAALMVLGIVTLVASMLSPFFAGMALLWGVATAAFTVVGPAVVLPLYAVVPHHMRSHVGALQGIFFAGVGGMSGLLLLSGIDRRFGVSGAIISLAIPGIASAFVLRTAARDVNADLDHMLDAIVEEEDVRGLNARGVQLPMLACRNIDFAYGQVQVLFGVNLTVDVGEMVALLGTNGAGKSTLLKCISGIGLPKAGSVRYRGADITYLDAERRLRLGITQIPGGRAVFGPMTVAENLRVFGTTLGRSHRTVDGAIDRCFDAFPRLGERRNQVAATLSGGEQQMLALSKALILRPRLLLIDELSLGLAPVVVAQLLDMVRIINADGTALVLVEQSVNISLNLVDHAYFMEKGEMRFDGRSDELLARPDLLRAVFLQGAATVGERS